MVGQFANRPVAAAATPGGNRPAVLTGREREVVGLVATGLSDAEIAARLVISPLTAKTHVARAIAKLGVRDRVQLVIVAYEDELVRAGIRRTAPATRQIFSGPTGAARYPG